MTTIATELQGNTATLVSTGAADSLFNARIAAGLDGMGIKASLDAAPAAPGHEGAFNRASAGVELRGAEFAAAQAPAPAPQPMEPATAPTVAAPQAPGFG